MFSLSEFVFRIYDHISESCVGGDTTSYDKEIKYRQAAYAEIGDQNEDDIYDYAPAAGVHPSYE
ncbi:hypothetical protein AXX17_AT1G41380 [Arabidopsis thaliana]|uniref:Uncharacterized protein n=1 Tax=Arabidopsis thaliana TaxID=3702 RepID=A0A178WB95_ARATH|nr:hypothetical protein AXX17_AT1G41380 [Arabidopsis thaliana]